MIFRPSSLPAFAPGFSALLISCSACWLSSGVATVPVSTAIWPAIVTCRSASGKAARSMPSTEVEFCATITLAE